GLAGAAAVVATAGGTVPWLSQVSVLATRSDRGPQRLPVNRTARAAGVSSVDGEWRLEVVGPRGTARFSLAELSSLPQTTAELPISCVEGWSRSAVWTGVRMADLLRAAGIEPDHALRVESLERGGVYASSTLPANHVADPLT